jgi:hypothetical protein
MHSCMFCMADLLYHNSISKLTSLVMSYCRRGVPIWMTFSSNAAFAICPTQIASSISRHRHCTVANAEDRHVMRVQTRACMSQFTDQSLQGVLFLPITRCRRPIEIPFSSRPSMHNLDSDTPHSQSQFPINFFTLSNIFLTSPTPNHEVL